MVLTEEVKDVVAAIVWIADKAGTDMTAPRHVTSLIRVLRMRGLTMAEIGGLIAEAQAAKV